MRILSISNTPHDPSQGSGYVITGYVEGLRDHGHRVDAFGPSDWRVWDVRRGRRYLYPLMIAGFGVRRFLEEKYDLVELWGGVTWLLALLIRGIAPDATIIHHSNGIEQHRLEVERQSPVGPLQNTRWFQFDLSPLFDWGLRTADAIVTVSSYDLPYLAEREYVLKERQFAIENPLPDLFLDQEICCERPRRIGFCGSWIPIKAPPVLVNDMARFLRRHPDWTFSVVGVGDTDVANAFPVEVREQIAVTPFLDREDLVDWYHSLAIFTLPSVYESFGLVMAEAMACGAALVATNVGYAHGLEHKREAMILPEAESPRLYEALTTLANDDSLRHRIAQKGYESVQESGWSAAVERLEEIYRLVSSGDTEG